MSPRPNTCTVHAIVPDSVRLCSVPRPPFLTEASNDATYSSLHGRSGQHVAHGQDFPSAVESAPSGGETPATRAKACSGNVTRSLQAFSTPKRSKRGCHVVSNAIFCNGLSSSSALSTKMRRQERVRKTRAEQRKAKERVDAPEYGTQQSRAREDARKV